MEGRIWSINTLTAAANQIRSEKIDFFNFFWMVFSSFYSFFVFRFSFLTSHFSSFFDSFIIILLQNIDFKKAICCSVYCVLHFSSYGNVAVLLSLISHSIHYIIYIDACSLLHFHFSLFHRHFELCAICTQIIHRYY